MGSQLVLVVGVGGRRLQRALRCWVTAELMGWWLVDVWQTLSRKPLSRKRSMRRLGPILNSTRVLRNPLPVQPGYILGRKGLWIIPSLPGSRNAGASIAAVKVITGVKIPDRVGVGSFESRQSSAAEIAETRIRAETGIAETNGSPARPGSWRLLGLPFFRAPAGFPFSFLSVAFVPIYGVRQPDGIPFSSLSVVFFPFYGVREPDGSRCSALCIDFCPSYGVRAPAGCLFSVPSAYAVFS
jgi:hypothetical protein